MRSQNHSKPNKLKEYERYHQPFLELESTIHSNKADEKLSRSHDIEDHQWIIWIWKMRIKWSSRTSIKICTYFRLGMQMVLLSLQTRLHRCLSTPCNGSTSLYHTNETELCWLSAGLWLKRKPQSLLGEQRSKSNTFSWKSYLEWKVCGINKTVMLIASILYVYMLRAMCEFWTI